MHIHRHCIQLSQTLDRPQQKHHQSSPLNSFNSPCHNVWSQGFKVLEDEYGVCRTENTMGVFVITPRNVGIVQEQFKVVHLFRSSRSGSVVTTAALGKSPLLIAFNLLHPLLAMGTKPKFLLVAPQDGGVAVVDAPEALAFGHVGGAIHDLVEVWDLVFAVVAYEEEEGALVGAEAVGEEGADSLV
eukprot:scaffold1928_cov109-Alexandrium_tamarense.AAC.42